MDCKDLALLERAFSNEISAAMSGSPPVMQTKATKRADALVADGLLVKRTAVWQGITMEGYQLTHAGRYAYCATCKDEPEPPATHP